MLLVIADDIEWESELGGPVRRLKKWQTAYDPVYESVALPVSIRAADAAATWPLSVCRDAQYCLVQARDTSLGIRSS